MTDVPTDFTDPSTIDVDEVLANINHDFKVRAHRWTHTLSWPNVTVKALADEIGRLRAQVDRQTQALGTVRGTIGPTYFDCVPDHLVLVTCICGEAFGVPPAGRLAVEPPALVEHRVRCPGASARPHVHAAGAVSPADGAASPQTAAEPLSRQPDGDVVPAFQPLEQHGWVTPHPSGVKAWCGGPALCAVCQAEQRALDAVDEHFADPGLLTADERWVIAMMGDVWSRVCGIVDLGPPRQDDLGELIVHVHAIQRAMGAQAAARAYPSTFRRLGSRLFPQPVDDASG